MELVKEKLEKRYSKLLKTDVMCRKIGDQWFADWESAEKWLPERFKSGHMYFEPKKPGKINELRYVKFGDPDSLIVFGVIQPVRDKNGHPIFRRFKLTGPENFDLSHPIKRIQAIILMHQEFVVGGPMYTQGSTMGYVDMRSIEEQASKNRKRRKKANMAFDIIEKLQGEQLFNFARLLVPVNDVAGNDKHDQEVIKDRLEEFAEENPEKFLNEWRNTDRNVKEIFSFAKDAGVVSYRRDLGWIYKESPLGHSEIEAMDAMKRTPNLLSSIARESINARKQSLQNDNFEIPSDIENIAKNISGLDLGDRSTSDAHKKAVMSDEFGAKMMEKIEEMVQKKVDKLLELKTQEKALEEKQDFFDQEEQEDWENAEAIEEAISKELDQIEQGLLEGKDETDWKYPELKKYAANTFEKEDYADTIKKGKSVLFAHLLTLKKKHLEEGIITPRYDSSGNN